MRRALTIGVRSYSIKQLEPLYMGAYVRDRDGVTAGAESVTAYAEAAALRSTPGDGSEARLARTRGDERLRDIAVYNRDDCVSTRKLRNWLLDRAAEHGIHPLSRAAEPAPDAPPVTSASPLAVRLAGLAARCPDTGLRRTAELAASAIDYHRREQKAFWWAHFARLMDPIDDWAQTRDVLVVDPCASTVSEDWTIPPRGRVERRVLRLCGTIAPGSVLRAGEVFLVYERGFAMEAAPGLRAARRARIVRVENGVVEIEERLGAGPEFSALPIAVVPGPPPHAGAQQSAIEWWASELAATLAADRDPRDPVADLLRRLGPRGTPGAAAPIALATGEDRIADACGILAALDRGTLAVQGPPGTGKTYLAAHALKRLVQERGWRIGVVAQSHRVVEHLLDRTVAAGLPAEQVGKVLQRGAAPAANSRFTVLPANGHQRFLRAHRDRGTGCVIGGTAWDFSHEARVARRELDLLVIDEAGQFAIAPTIAAAVAAQRLLLLGDPQQLPQVTQGHHPEPVDASALAWLLGEQATLPDDVGLFLSETRRMRPELAEVVSEFAYAGRLRAHASTSERTVTDAGRAGLTWHPVRHTGRSTAAPEEARVVLGLIEGFLTGRLEVAGSGPRALEPADLIVVAAYNAQVECVRDALERAGHSGIRVGTVDRFQGQEAVIAIVTLAASSAEDVPRGMEFLLMRNRLNVAISRAQWGAHLVSSDRLGDGLPDSAEGLAALSGYLRLLERGAPGSVDV